MGRYNDTDKGFLDRMRRVREGEAEGEIVEPVFCTYCSEQIAVGALVNGQIHIHCAIDKQTIADAKAVKLTKAKALIDAQRVAANSMIVRQCNALGCKWTITFRPSELGKLETTCPAHGKHATRTAIPPAMPGKAPPPPAGKWRGLVPQPQPQQPKGTVFEELFTSSPSRPCPIRYYCVLKNGHSGRCMPS